MITNYLKTALRHVFGNVLYSTINIVGLGIGLACCLMILLFVRYEFSYDTGFANADRIYRVSREFTPDGGARARVPASANAPFLPALLAEFPEIEKGGRIVWGGVYLERDGEGFSELDVRYTDQGVLDVFDFPWLAGDRATALTAPGSVVLTESLLRKYFGNDVAPASVIGERIGTSGEVELQVTGVIADLPANTHILLTGMVSMTTLSDELLSGWDDNTDFHTYITLPDAAYADPLQQQMPAFLARHVNADDAAHSALKLMNIRDIHLRSAMDEEWKPHGNINVVYSFLGIAFAVLAIACINFMSIATARSSQRAKEVGMRLSIGANRAQLIWQFLSEALFTAILAMIVALIGVELLLPAYGAFIGADLEFSYVDDGQVLLTLLLLTIGVTLASGAYPALYLSAFQPARVLKGDLTRGRNGQTFRQVMVVLQFSIAIVLITAAWIMQQQRELADQIELGFDKDSVLVLRTSAPRGFNEDWTLLKQQLNAVSGVESVTTSHFLPFGFNDNQLPVTRASTSVRTRMQLMLVDYDFFATYGMEIKDGRSFSEEFPSDALITALAGDPAARPGFILNESALRALGFDEANTVGEELSLDGFDTKGTLVGVVADTAFESIRRSVRPLIFMLDPPEASIENWQYTTASLRLTDTTSPETLASIASVWQRLYPDIPLNQHYLHEDFDAMYQPETRLGQLFRIFATMAVTIACFGLFGLATFNAERRTKEIGVRKVMGSSVWKIVVLLTNDFSKLVLLSNLIAWPIAWYAMTRWLQTFAYRVDMTLLFFVGSGLIALCIAWVTVGSTAAKAANTRPVLALRYE